jgi:hypothetical protein
MSIKRAALAACLTLAAAVSVAGAASADTRWEHRHPRQEQVLNRVDHQRREIRKERREGELGRYEARRLLMKDRHIAREDHRLSRHNGGYITRVQHRRLNHQEDQVRRALRG